MLGRLFGGTKTTVTSTNQTDVITDVGIQVDVNPVVHNIIDMQPVENAGRAMADAIAGTSRAQADAIVKAAELQGDAMREAVAGVRADVRAGVAQLGEKAGGGFGELREGVETLTAILTLIIAAYALLRGSEIEVQL